MKLLKLIPAAAIALTMFGSLDAFADSNSKQNDAYNLYCGANSGNKWYHKSSKSSDRHYHSCDNYQYKNPCRTNSCDRDVAPYNTNGKDLLYCSSTSVDEGISNGTCSKK